MGNRGREVRIEKRVVVAGHICLDVIPAFPVQEGSFRDRFAPGGLVHVGPAQFATGGAVSNTGRALHQLGLPVSLIGKIGRDLFGKIVISLLEERDPGLAADMVVDEGSGTSYTIVVSPPGSDRFFMHWTGANDTFCARDVTDDHLLGIRLFHFGYPPLMRRMYEADGRELSALFRRVKSRGVVTSLDMAKPDPASEAGRIDWTGLLKNVLPHVDLFLPSFDEILYMIEPETFHLLAGEPGEGNPISKVETPLLDRLAERLIEMGCHAAAIKLGDGGLYLRTGAEASCLAQSLGVTTDYDLWRNRQLLVPCFRTNMAGATGAGDCTIAGFLASILNGGSPVEALLEAVGVGACCIEAPDATSGVPHRDVVLDRIRSGWEKLETSVAAPGWKWDDSKGLLSGPRDMA